MIGNLRLNAVRASHVIPTLRVAADGSGSYLTIEDALTSAPATGGAIISIKDGTYTPAGALAVNKPKLQIIGDSEADVIINAPLSSANAVNVTADDVLIQTVTIDGRRAAGGQGSGVSVSSAQRLHLKECIIKNTLGDGVHVVGSPVKSSDGIIEHCTISNLAINSVTPVAGAFQCGIQIISGGDRWSIHDNEIAGWSQAIGLWYSCDSCTIYINNIHDNYGYADAGHTIPRSAVEVYPADTPGGHHDIYGNTIEGTTLHCIESAQGDNSTHYHDNTLRNWNGFGDGGNPVVFADGGATQQNINVLFDYNHIYAPDRTGVVSMGGRATTFSNNDLHDFINVGLNFVADLATFDGQSVISNTFNNCIGGIYFGSGSSHIVTDNTFTSPVTSPLGLFRIVAGDGHTISRNTATATTDNIKGIWASTGSGHVIQDNNFSIISWCIQFTGDTHDCTIGGSGHSNTFICSFTGAYVLNFSGAGVTGNVITYNTITSLDDWYSVGFLSGATGNTLQHNTITGGTLTPGTGNTIGPNP